MADASRLIEVADMLTAQIASHLGLLAGAAGSELPAGRCERVWSIRLTRETLAAWIAAVRTFTVYVIPLMEDSAVLTRGEDTGTYRFAVVFVESCPDQGGASVEWIDKRALLVSKIVSKFGEVREPLDGAIDGPRCESAMILDPLVDPEFMNVYKLFWAEAVFEYREVE